MPATLTTATSPNVTLSASHVTLSDSATLSGGSNPTGTITFTLTAPGGSIFDTETVTANGNGNYATPVGFTLSTIGTVAGTYSWNATYSGDLNNNAATASPEQTVVSPASPGLSTTASPGGGLALTDSPVTLTDTAQLLGGYFPTGAIVFTLSGPGGFLFTQTDTVSGNGPYTAAATLPTAGTVVGTYSWTAHYIGDANNNPSNASVAQTVVSPASPGLSTTASPGGIAGTTLTDIAHLSGGYFPTGTITFLLTATSGSTVDTETVAVNGDGTYATPTGFTLPKGTVPGTYAWHVLYNGDGNNNAVTANFENVTVGVNPSPPPGTTADMILRHSSDGSYEIYDIGNNSILMARPLGQVGTEWTVAGLGTFSGNDTTDMILRDSNNGAFEVYDISNNNITNAASMGAVGLAWAVAGFGDFSNHAGETDMMLRNMNTGGFEVYDISNNQITNAAFMGAVGLNWQFSGVGNFSGLGESDMLLRNSNTGGLEVYDIANNQLTGAAFIGNVGVDWQFSGVGNFSGIPGESDMILRNTNTGGLEVYDINNNQITGAAFLGTVGLDWQFAGIGPVHGAGESDLVLRNKNTGAFEVYDIANNQLTGAAPLGAVGMDWQLGGFAVDPPTASTGSMDGSSDVAQLAQAMAGFGGESGEAAGLTAVPPGSDTSQQPLLTAPQHA